MTLFNSEIFASAFLSVSVISFFNLSVWIAWLPTSSASDSTGVLGFSRNRRSHSDFEMPLRDHRRNRGINKVQKLGWTMRGSWEVEMVRREMVAGGFNEVARRSLKCAGTLRRSITFNAGGIFVDVDFLVIGNAEKSTCGCLRIQKAWGA